MIPQIVLLCFLFQLGNGDLFKFIPGQYPGEQELKDAFKESPYLEDFHIPLWAHAIRALSSEEDMLKLIFRFFNRPDSHRYILDIILLIGNLNVTDEGFGPYFERENGRIPLQSIIDKILASAESSTVGSTVEALASIENEGAEEGVGSYSEYMVYPSAEAYQSAVRESNIPEHLIQQTTEDDGEMALESTEPAIDSTTEYIIYQSTEAEDVDQTTADAMEQSEYTEESTGHQSSEGDSSKIQHRFGFKYPHYKPRKEWRRKYPHRKPHDHRDDSSEEDSSEESSEEVDRRTGLAPESMQSEMDSTTEYLIYQSTEDEEVSRMTADEIEGSDNSDSFELSEVDSRTELEPDHVFLPETIDLDATEHDADSFLGFIDHDSMENVGEEVSKQVVNGMESKFMDPESVERQSLEEDSSELEHSFVSNLAEHMPMHSESVERRSGLSRDQIDMILHYESSLSHQKDDKHVDPTTEHVPHHYMMDSAAEASSLPEDEMGFLDIRLESSERPSVEESSKFERRYGKDHSHGSRHVSEHYVPKSRGIPDHVSELHYMKPDANCDHKDHSHHHKEPSITRQVGSVRAIPGVHFPDYKEIPLTSFTCSDKKYIPGFYADLDTGCQVFHVCWPHRRESFLCPIGTIFNQPLLACDYWYNGDCSMSPRYYKVNKDKHIPKRKIPVVIDHFEEKKIVTERPRPVVITERPTITPELPRPVVITKRPTVIDHLKKKVVTELPIPLVIPKRPTVIDHLEKKLVTKINKPFKKWSEILKFLPVKSKVTIYSEDAQKSKHVAPEKKTKMAEIKAVKKAFASKVIQDVLGVAEDLVKNVEPLVAQVASVGHLPMKSMHGVIGKKQKKLFGNPPVAKVVLPPLEKPASLKLPGKLDRFGDYYDYEEKDYGQKRYVPKRGRQPEKKKSKLDDW